MNHSLSEGLLKLSMPLVKARVCGVNLTFLIDTGSTHNVIASFVYEQIRNAFMITGESNKVMGVDGKYQDVIIVNATLEIEGVELKSDFNVVDMSDAVMQLQDETGLQLHGLLGIPFLMDNKCIIDFDKQEITINP
ncbi:MAG: retroviral-like aspartic protease [Bacteroidaceae bacterium]|nr:retroviral-like aspartic protease [Bacteroidaceae bacterium]